MKNETYQSIMNQNEVGEFANFYFKYLHGSSTQNEAFLRAKCIYRKLFKKIPFKNFQSFQKEFNSLPKINVG